MNKWIAFAVFLLSSFQQTVNAKHVFAPASVIALAQFGQNLQESFKGSKVAYGFS